MKKTRLSLSSQILVGLVAGVVFGVFFGDESRYLNIIGKAYVNLLQMSVLPYIVVSLIHGIGSLSAPQARRFAATGGVFLLVFWGLGVFMILAATFAFPKIETASFFSAVVTEMPDATGSPLDMYIPANPFRSLADNVIPAVAVFSIFLGVALIGIEGKEPLLQGMRLLVNALMRVAGLVVKVAPLGVFALTASAAGTISIAELSRLQVFLITSVAAGCLLAFAILPGLVNALTGFRYRDIMGTSRDALILAFTTANAFVVLPLIVENVKSLFAGHGSAETKERDSLVGATPPLAYNFSLPGKLLPLLFVFFTAWFYDHPIDLAGHLKAFALGLLSLLGSPRAALPFLLHQMKLPEDIFQLYLISEIIVDRVNTLLTCVSLFAFTILSAAMMEGLIKVRLRKVLVFSGIVFVVTLGTFLAARQGLYLLTKDTYRGKEIITGMKVHEVVPAKVFTAREQAGPHGGHRNGSSMQEIRSRKVLRVGYRPDVIPFSYFNRDGELVGYDIAFAHRLAKDLGCSLEFIPTDSGHVASDLKQGVIDIMTSKVVVTPETFADLRFSESYLTLHAAFVVEDSRKRDFMNLKELKKNKTLRIAVSQDNVYHHVLRALLPRASLVILDRKERFFTEKAADALFVTAEEGASWTLIHPFYDVAETRPALFMEFLAYPVARESTDFLEYVNHWIRMQRQSGVQQKEYDYWILGKNPYEQKPRWSVIKDVLHWVE